MTKQHKPAFGWLSIFVVAAALLMCSGCTDDQIAQGEAVRATIDENIAKTQAALEVTPPGKTRDALLEVLAGYNKQHGLIDEGIASLKARNVTPGMLDALHKLPVVGPYADLAALIGALGYGLFKGMQKKKADAALDMTHIALTQVVKGVENVLPDKTETQKLQLAAAQDDTTKALVSAIKGD